MAGPAIVIPLIATYGPSLSAAAGAGGAALLGLATGRALNLYRNTTTAPTNLQTGNQEVTSTQQLLDISNPANAYADQVLTLGSSNGSFVDAAANYIKAENDFLIKQQGTVQQGPAASLEAAQAVAEKYDFVAADETTGRLGVLADATLANGGDLEISVQNQNLVVSNDLVKRTIPYKDYGESNLPLAVEQNVAVDVELPEESNFALIVNQEIASTNLELVAQTAIVNNQIDQNNIEQYSPKTSISAVANSQNTDTAELKIPEELNNSDIVLPSSPGVNQIISNRDDVNFVVPADLPAELVFEATNQSRTNNAYLEDSTANIANLEQVRENNQAMDLAKKDANTQAATINPTGGNTVEMPPPPTNISGNQPTNNSAASNSSYNTQERKTQNISVNGVSRSIESTPTKINPLHSYVNYTYKFGLYSVPRNTINKIANGEISPGNEEAILANGSLLISSGGAGGQSSRSALFGIDFYIDNVQLSSVVGQGARTRGSDVIEFNFDIIEPYNTTLLPRLIAESYKQTGKPDFAMVFFVMKIDFLGYNDNGEPTSIPKTSKFLPFQMINMEFEVTAKGTVYKIKAIPVCHIAKTILDNTIPFHMEIAGGTINEIFNGDAAITTSNSASNPRTENTNTSGVSSGPKTYSKGVKQALDEGEKYLVTTKSQSFPNTYKFEFRDGVGDAKVVDPQVYRTQGFRMSDNKKPEELNPKNTKLDPTKNTVRIQAGSKITDLINNVLQVSDYYTGQFTNERRPNKPLMFHKIIPLVKFGELDPRTNLYQRDITYVIKPYTMHGSDKENFGQKAPSQTVKRYQWIYTGQNRDIINFKLAYQMAFFELRNGADKAMVAEGEGEEANPLDGAGGSSDEYGVLDTGIFPRRVRPVFGIADQNNSAAKDRSIKTLKLEELFKKQFDSAGDLISLDLEIVGDPDLIQQDNILYGASGRSNQLIYDSGSINFTDHEAYFYIDFKNPITDYNDDTGLFNLSSEETNFFSGLYRIIEIKSNFRGGKFTQTLQNYRVRRQSDAQNSDSARTTATSSQPKAETATNTVSVAQPAATTTTEQAIANVRSAPDETAALIANNPQSTAGTPVELATGTALG